MAILDCRIYTDSRVANAVASLAFSEALRLAASGIVSSINDGNGFNAVHLRIEGDWQIFFNSRRGESRPNQTIYNYRVNHKAWMCMLQV